MAYNISSRSCFDIAATIFFAPPEVCLNFTAAETDSIFYYCAQVADAEREDKYSKPMVWIGVYIAVASLFCILAMSADLWNGFRYKKFWFPSKYFSLNAVSITVITVAMKLPMDLNSGMRGVVDQGAKLGSLVFMCTMIANLMPSLASMDNKELSSNVIGFSILIITIIVNTIMEIITGNIYHNILAPITGIYVLMLLFLLIVLISVATSVPISKQILELKYHNISKTPLNDQRAHDRFIIERLRQHVKRYGIMVETGSPQFVMASNVLSSACGVICGIGLVVYIFLAWKCFEDLDYFLQYSSPYKWSIYAIGTTQFIGVFVGSIAPIFRCTTVANYKSFARLTRKHFMLFKVEKYWTQKLYDWKESHITVLSGSRRSRSVFRSLKRTILSLWIGIQKATGVICKMICLIQTLILILVTWCSNYLMYYLNNETLSNTVSSNGDTSDDLNRYVLLLEDNTKLSEKTLRRISNSLNCLIQTAEKEQDKNLLKLLQKSIGFQDIGSDKSDNLFKSVAEGLSYTHLVDESLNNLCQYVNVQKVAMTLWDEVEDKCKWLGNTLEKSAFEGKTAKEILEWFAHKAEGIVNEAYNSCVGEPMEKLPQKLIIANSMKRIAQTIICTYNISEITKKQLFVLLSHMIADILVACFTNIPRVITMKCHESAIEKRVASVESAAKLRGRTTKIIEIATTCELPSIDPDKLAIIDEWRHHLQRIP